MTPGVSHLSGRAARASSSVRSRITAPFNAMVLVSVYRDPMVRVAVLGALASLVAVGACTSGDPAPKRDESLPMPTQPPPWVTETLPAEPTTRPLVIATNIRRPPMSLPKAVAEWVTEGLVDNWDQLGQPSAPLRVIDRSDRLDRLPMNAIAVGVADADGPGGPRHRGRRRRPAAGPR